MQPLQRSIETTSNRLRRDLLQTTHGKIAFSEEVMPYIRQALVLAVAAILTIGCQSTDDKLNNEIENTSKNNSEIVSATTSENTSKEVETVKVLSEPFLMPIEDVFSIPGRDTVVTGRVKQGVVKVGDEIEIVGGGKPIKRGTVAGIEMFRKLLDQAEAGNNVGVLIKGIERSDITRGQVLATPGSVR